MLSLDIIETVARSPKLSGWEGLGMAVQAYSKRARAVCGWANALGRETGKRMSIRLVKGAYWDSEIKYTQERGLSDYPLRSEEHTSELQSLMRTSYAVFCLKKKKKIQVKNNSNTISTN